MRGQCRGGTGAAEGVSLGMGGERAKGSLSDGPASAKPTGWWYLLLGRCVLYMLYRRFAFRFSKTRRLQSLRMSLGQCPSTTNC